jgi:hypothetical protein
MSQTKFIGDAGEHYVAYKLARRNLHVGLTLGNMPNIDLLISSKDGLKSISLQVKTSQGAYRKNRYGAEGYEWDVNAGVIGRHSKEFWFAFVDFKWIEEEPDVYIIPSLWVAEFVKPDFSRKMYFLPQKAADLTRNKWEIFDKVFDGDKELLEWATKWDEELLIKWGE